MEGDVIITQDLFVYDMHRRGRATATLIGRHRSTGIGRPRFWDRARYYGEEKRLAAALDAAEVAGEPPALSGPMPWTCRPLALFFLATVAVGGVAWVFVYPLPVGRAEGREAHGERRRAAEPVARARDARRAEDAARAGRGHAEGARAAPDQEQQAAAARRCSIDQAGLSWSKQQLLSSSRRVSASGRLRRSSCSACRPAAGARLRLRGRVRPAALAARLSQEAAREQVPATSFPTPSTSSCAASRPACRCSTA